MSDARILPVISYDPDKVYLRGKYLVKITNEKEVLNLERMRDLARNHKLFLPGFGVFQIRIPEIELFDGCQKLKMEFIHGATLESLLKTSNHSHRIQLLRIIKVLFRWFSRNLIVWHDFAPRNVIIDFDKKIVGFVDFERGITTINGRVDESELCFYLSNTVAEEWGAFLTAAEFNYLLPSFWNKAKETGSDPAILTSKRRLAIAQALWPGKDVTAKDVVFISQAMQEVAQATENRGVFIFPLIAIESLTKRLGPNYYARIVLRHLQRR